jgi:hypothetical protein
VTRDIRAAGERQAMARAGPWPRHGTIADYELAVATAVREARRTGDIGFRFNRRYRFWENPVAYAASEHQGARLDARRRKAIEIAEERRSLLQQLRDEAPRGAA